MRHSKQRDLIYNIVKSTTAHPTADYVYDKARQVDGAISLGTVYRNLKQLCDMGIIHTVETQDKSIRYDGQICPHQHFICKKCLKVYDIDMPLSMPKQLEEMGFEVHTQKSVYYGTCSDCKEK